MTVYVQIGEISEITNQSPNNGFISWSGNGAYFNSSNVRSSIYVFAGGGANDSTAWFSGPSFSATNLWIHANIFIDRYFYNIVNPSPTTSMLRIMANGVQRFRLVPYDHYTLKLEKWDGSNWVVLATYVHQVILGEITQSRRVFDIHATIGASASIVVYMDNTIIIAVDNVDTTFGGTVSAFDDVIFGTAAYSGFANGSVNFSEIIIADWNTVNSKLVVRYPDANGFYSEWENGDFTVVDEIYGGTDYATSLTANQRVDWSMTNFPAPSAVEIIPSVKVTASLNRDLIGPQAANFYIRRNGIDYDNTDMALNLLQRSESKTYTLDPSTNDVWTATNLNSSTFGIRSRT